MKNNMKKEYRPRVIVKGNTGTRVMRSRKDKAMTRQNLKKSLREMY